MKLSTVPAPILVNQITNLNGQRKLFQDADQNTKCGQKQGKFIFFISKTTQSITLKMNILFKHDLVHLFVSKERIVILQCYQLL